MNTEMIETVRLKFELLKPVLNEKTRRLLAAAEAHAFGRGGIASVSKATGMSRTTIHQGIKELQTMSKVAAGTPPRIRASGGGRKPLTTLKPTLLEELDRLIEPLTRGDPESALRWTCKSTRKLAAALAERGFKIGRQSVARLLFESGYSLQSNRKVREGDEHPDRDAQFRHINDTVTEYQARGQPVISVDTKKKELIGDFKNPGREWHPRGQPEEVRTHDFVDKELGKVTPYGVYDPTANVGWVSVGTDHDTAEFAVESIRRWWLQMGQARYRDADELMITADCGGSNGYRLRLWKLALQVLANEFRLRIAVCHLPPGTSKWNKIEHRMFSHISMNWRGKPLISHEVVVNLIANTTTSKGLSIQAALDTNQYVTGLKISDAVMAEINILRNAFHGEWNYVISPNCPC